MKLKPIKTIITSTIFALTSTQTFAVEVSDICPDAASRNAIHAGLETLLKAATAEKRWFCI